MMTNQDNTSERGVLATFYSTLCHRPSKDEVDSIIIPIVQRDYAEGRPSARKIRTNFLKALYDHIDTPDAKPIELDFVYGDLREENRQNVFYPLDGQQRLTTLFLLHWYVAKRIGADTRFLKDFSYETRESSKAFCKKLLDINPFPAQTDAQKNRLLVDDFIKDSNWFNSTWASDPTIASMLVVLRDIDIHYRTCSTQRMEDVWRNLIGNDDELGKIRFYRLYLKDIGATDDLYIKMNSRGKPLTDFEHFKAEMGRYCDSNFIFKVDTRWTNLLWDYRNKSNDGNPQKYEDNDLDKKFLRLIRAYLTAVGIQNGLLAYNDAIAMDDFELLGSTFGSKDAKRYISDFETIMDFFADMVGTGLETFFRQFLTDDSHSQDHIYVKTGIDLVRTACSNDKPTMSFLILLSAFFDAILHYSAQPVDQWHDEFIDRLRVIRNLMVNSTDVIRDENIHNLLLRVRAIVNDGDIAAETADFTVLQKRQEERKLSWAGNDEERRHALYAAENHPLLYGNLHAVEPSTDYDKDVLRKFVALFSDNGKMDSIKGALLAMGDYGYYDGSRLNYGGRGIDTGDEWHTNVFVNRNEVTGPVLLALLNKLDTCSTDELEAIRRQFLDDCQATHTFPWRYYLAKYSGMRYGESGKYYLPDAQESRYKCIMMNKSQFNGKHWDPFLFCINKGIGKGSMSGYGGPYILPDKKSELANYSDHYELTVAGEGNYIIPIEQEQGVDKEDRIAKMIPTPTIEKDDEITGFMKSLRKLTKSD